MITRREFLKYAASAIGVGISKNALADGVRLFSFPKHLSNSTEEHVKDYLHKMRRFEERHEDDLLLQEDQAPLLERVVYRLKGVEGAAGHANFSLMAFDEVLKTAQNHSDVGPFSKEELDLIEMIFYRDAADYGFYGDKPFVNLTDMIDRSNVIKIPGTGNYLYRGMALETYERLKNDIGNDVILTSGIRSVSKQLTLFLNKALKNSGNLSLASRSLAPPGYSFHSIGDFDVGQVGYGVNNFTERFTNTDVYHKLSHLGYVTFRYNRDNMLGVRYEPWHIKLNS